MMEELVNGEIGMKYYLRAESRDGNKGTYGDKESDTYCNKYHYNGGGPLDELFEQM